MGGNGPCFTGLLITSPRGVEGGPDGECDRSVQVHAMFDSLISTHNACDGKRPLPELNSEMSGVNVLVGLGQEGGGA